MALFPVAGCHIYIGGVLSDKSTDFVAADFSTQVWTEIDGWTNAGPIGDSGQLITTPIINRGRDTKQKGTSNAGAMANEFTQIILDPGQILLLAASIPTDKSNRAIRVDLNDAVGGAPSKRFFIALIMNAVESGGGANTIRMLKSDFEINSNIVRVAAT
jgi:hypothetical protein